MSLLLMSGATIYATSRPDLQLWPPTFTAEGMIQLSIGHADGTDLAIDRIPRLEVVKTSDLSIPIDQWSSLETVNHLNNGTLWMEFRPEDGVGLRQYYAARERSPLPPAITVSNSSGLRTAVASATPGTRILLAPGTYPGDFYFANLHGDTNRPIVMSAADPQNPPVIQGGGNGMQLTDPRFVELHHLVFTGATGNGLNIDDGGSFDTPAHHIVLSHLKVTEVGPEGNRDGIKLSGVINFRVEGCTIERWGTGGSAIDMVGCHDGTIESNLFRHTVASANEGANGIQTKGGSSGILILRNRFENAGSRAVNIGGSTGLTFFRPPLQTAGEHSEAKDIRVEGNTFIGSSAPLAYVGVDGAVVRFNTIYRPQRWALRILQENTAPGFAPCRNGSFTDNIIAFHSSQWSSGGVNIGPNTAPATFQFARNWWYCLDAPSRSRPALPTTEIDGHYGQSPQFRDAEAGDFRVTPDSPARNVGAEARP